MAHWAVGVLVALLLPLVIHGHTHMQDPMPQFPPGFTNGMSPVGIIKSGEIGIDISNQEYPTGGSKLALEKFGGSLRDFIYKFTKFELQYPKGDPLVSNECGMSLLTGEKKTLGNTVSFPWGHPGPCEIWCDDVLLFSHHDDCQKNLGGDVKTPIDPSKCAGKSILQGMYIGTHVASEWQTYLNCVPLQGGTSTDLSTIKGGGGGPATSTNTSATTTPSTPAPTPTTTAPVAVTTPATGTSTTGATTPATGTTTTGATTPATGTTTTGETTPATGVTTTDVTTPATGTSTITAPTGSNANRICRVRVVRRKRRGKKLQ